ncbi:MAG: hypothetical protein J7J98_03830 [candidate division Zixibacteria bacterium]|nr:hypothetical protein [candidate division Zixibacteria bacterium]
MGYQTVLVVLDTVDTLIEKCRFADAKEMIQQILLEDIEGGSDRELLGRYFLTLGKINVWTNVNDIEPFERAIEIFRSDDLAVERYGEALLWKGMALRRTAKFPEAREALRTASTWFNHLGLPEQEARALDSIGYCAGQEGNIEVACAAYEKAIELFRSEDNRVKVRLSVLGLARIYVNVGRLQAAKEILISCPISRSDLGDPVAVYYNTTLGMVFTQLGEYLEAGRLIKAIRESASKQPSLHALYWQERGRLRYNEGEFEAALKAFKKAHEIAGDDSDMTCGVIRWMGECCLSLERLGLAKGYADHALTISKTNGDRWIMAASKRVLAGVCSLKGDSQSARQMYRAAIDEFKRIKHEYELAITRQRAAESDLFSEDQSKEWQRQADEYFDRESVIRNGNGQGA